MTKHIASITPSTSTKPKAYSYVRFSTPEQQKGDSLRRQMEAAKRYAEAKNLDLQELTFQDLGVSAYRGANAAETGRLREFLDAVHHDDIKAGSYLLVESLDRISRQKPRKAVRLLEEICEAGIAVVTLNDGRVYTEDNLDSDSWSLMGAMMVAIRAHEESETKGRRLRESWSNKRARATEKPLTALCPGWLRLSSDRSGFDVIPERAAIVRRVFADTLAGKGQHAIAEALNREGVPVFGRGRMWHKTYVAKMLADRSTVGEHVPHRIEIRHGKKVRLPTAPIEGYFPAVIDRETFERVAALSNGRSATPKGATAGTAMANILAGLAKCPRCGATMTRVNKGAGKKAGRPYLVCTTAKAGAGCEYRQVRLEDVEATIVDKVDELLSSLPSPSEQLQADWDRLTVQDLVMGEEIEKLVAAITEAGHSQALLDRLREAETTLEEIRAQMAEIEGRIADTLTNRVQNTVVGLVDAVAVESRNVPAINATMRQLFDKVEVDWASGHLCFHWKHAPGETTRLVYAWPTENQSHPRRRLVKHGDNRFEKVTISDEKL